MGHDLLFYRLWDPILVRKSESDPVTSGKAGTDMPFDNQADLFWKSLLSADPPPGIGMIHAMGL